MNRLAKVITEIDRRTDRLLDLQQPDGSWRFSFENALLTDAYMIIMLRTLEWDDEMLIRQLTRRLLAKQTKNGTWKAYPDERMGNLSATAEAYAALLYSGIISRDAMPMKKAARFIRENGGLKKTSLLTKVFFAFNGLYPWPDREVDPSRLFRIMKKVNMNFYDLGSYARAHFAPVLLGMAEKFQVHNSRKPCLKHLFTEEDRRKAKGKKNSKRPLYSIQSAFLENYILKRVEEDGTLLSYATSTFLMIYGLLAIGYKPTDPVIHGAITGLICLVHHTGKTFHLQNSPPTVWDTSLVSYTLLSSGAPPSSSQMRKSLSFVQKHQQTRLGDWKFHNPDVMPGGWGFSKSNTIHPDIDDTQAALRTMFHYAKTDRTIQHAYKRGVGWLLSMQNKDGGWPAFEKDTNKRWMAKLPIENAGDALTDPSTADLTGRTLEFLGNYEGIRLSSPNIQSAVLWLKQHQESNGSWYGRWGICYIYGTWAGITGLMAAGITHKDPAVQKAVEWLTSIQKYDGGWGESCKSDINKHYCALPYSTITQTAWAVDALIAACPKPTDSIKRGIDYLLHRENYHGIHVSYPTGAGLPGTFYMYYHSYNYIWPLLALCHYRDKYGNN
ncbi:prenyltransferase/squalene oxidase repeat-containing protein [Fictibacillus enclensis]|uniref:terpene cyclase/mutase family protein n=1 Tax=Fictibacillus enclensis TaxID=1017270 RepID=UPI0025A07254|nr:prenyltransferase/squalene oxidase repeat-containing protein [Fictibacillus enclensis]MDM5339145.1 prenyltransferase/squalene oxidase repeat-containing protein [Fictibacillus enclensis]